MVTIMNTTGFAAILFNKKAVMVPKNLKIGPSSSRIFLPLYQSNLPALFRASAAVLLFSMGISYDIPPFSNLISGARLTLICLTVSGAAAKLTTAMFMGVSCCDSSAAILDHSTRRLALSSESSCTRRNQSPVVDPVVA